MTKKKNRKKKKNGSKLLSFYLRDVILTEVPGVHARNDVLKMAVG